MPRWNYLIEADAADRAFLRAFDPTDINDWAKLVRRAKRIGKQGGYILEPKHYTLTLTPRRIERVDVPNRTLYVNIYGTKSSGFRGAPISLDMLLGFDDHTLKPAFVEDPDA